MLQCCRHALFVFRECLCRAVTGCHMNLAGHAHADIMSACHGDAHVATSTYSSIAPGTLAHTLVLLL